MLEVSHFSVELRKPMDQDNCVQIVNDEIVIAQVLQNKMEKDEQHADDPLLPAFSTPIGRDRKIAVIK